MYPTSVLLASTAFLAMASGHMTMKTPQPFTFPDSGTAKSPLDPQGADFPCKMGSGGKYTAQGAPTKMAIGEEQTLSFEGTAVHGGGSCQISLTKDKAPTKDSKWMVIHSIEGGCPARNQAGNLPEGGPSDQDTYKFKIPSGIAPGDYVFAWTWLNRIGNREFYMNCAPITVTAGASKRSPVLRREAYNLTRRADFPDMFLANLGPVSNQCSTQEAETAAAQAIAFPNPGASVEQPEGATNLHKMSCDGHGGASGSSGSSGSSAGAGAPSAAAPSAAAPSANAGGSFQEPSSAAAPSAAAQSAAAPSVATPEASAPAAGSSSSSSSSSGAQTGACTSEGMFNCIGGSQFQQCASGSWSVAQAMAPGTKCTPGQSATLGMARA
ncbi:MAG: hypothetical protein MMC23_001488 [Stictis urceolatum]|nr:hypothetical protein [Stictis urceolata]